MKNISITRAIQDAYRTEPVNVSGIENLSYLYYRELLLRKIKGIFEIECPETWDKDFLLNELITHGVFCVTELDSEPFGIDCEPYGVSLYYRPRFVTISNPVALSLMGENGKREIGIDCELVYLAEMAKVSEFYNLNFLIGIFAQKLAACDKCIDMSLMNSGVSAIFSGNKKACQSYKKMYDDISNGQPAAFVDESLGLSGSATNLTYTPAKDNFICDKVQIEKRSIIEEFLTDIGVNNANIDKRERLNADEVNSNNEELFISTALWRMNLETCCKKVNKMFPSCNLRIALRQSIIDSEDEPSKNGEKESEEKDEGNDAV